MSYMELGEGPVSGKLIAEGDPPAHRHELPAIPTEEVRRFVGMWITEEYQLENAVAQCGSCGRTFVSREDPDGYGRHVYWVRLRWWHRKAWAKLRVEEARRIGGVAP